MKNSLDHARELLHKADNDLIAARAILATGEALDTVCFHAQQAVEKSIKAVLALHDIPYPRRHDLAELMNLVKPIAAELLPYEHDITSMTPFAVDLRYDNEFEPSKDNAEESLEIAARVYDLTRAKIGQSSQNT